MLAAAAAAPTCLPRTLQEACQEVLASELARPPGIRSRSILYGVSRLPPEHREAIWDALARAQLLDDEAAWDALWCRSWGSARQELVLSGCVALCASKVAERLELDGCGASLTSLGLAGSARLIDANVQTICSVCPLLVSVDLSGCCALGDPAVQALGGLVHLSSLSVAGCWRVADVAPLSCVTAMAALDLSRCWQVRPATLSLALGSFRELRDLQVSQCHRVTGECLEALLPSASAGSLRKLGLTGTQVGDGFLRWLSQSSRCAGLESLRIGNGTRVGASPGQNLAAVTTGVGVVALAAAKRRLLNGINQDDVIWARPLTALALVGVQSWGAMVPEDGADQDGEPNDNQAQGAALGALWGGGQERPEDALSALGAEGSAQLRSLDLSGCRFVTSRTLAWLSSSCQGLTSLTLASCPLEDADLHHLEPMTALRNLNLAKCFDKGTSAAAKRKPAGSAFLRPHQKRARGMEGAAGPIRRTNSAAASSGATRLVAALPSLQTLSLSGCWSVSDQTLSCAPVALSRLDISSCKRVTEYGLMQAAARCSQLSSLRATGCSGLSSNAALGTHCRVSILRELRLPAPASAKACVAAVTTPDAPYCGDREEFRRGDDPGAASPAPFPLRRSFSPLWATSRSLRKIELKGCESLDDSDVLRLAAGAPLLQAVLLYQATGLTDESLRHLAFHLPRLAQVAITGALGVGDEGVCALLSGLCQIESLEVSKCRRITDRSIAAIAGVRHTGTATHGGGDSQTYHPAVALTSLAVSWCPELSDVGLQQVLSSCLNLSSLSASGTRATDATAAAALSTCRNLKSLYLGTSHVTGSFTAAFNGAAGSCLCLETLQAVELPRCSAASSLGLRRFFDVSQGWRQAVKVSYG